jgi:predicted RNase H-like HicB family nuclease
MKYPVILENGGDGWIVARCPTVPGCYAQGETRAEALLNVQDVLALTLQARKDLGLSLLESEREFAFIEATEIELNIELNIELKPESEQTI